MAEDNEPILRGELLQIVERLDVCIASLDSNMAELRSDIRRLTNWLIGLYLFILTVAGVSLAIVKVL